MVRLDGRGTELWRELESQIRIEWVAVTLVLTLLTGLLSYFGNDVALSQFNYFFYDKTLSKTIQPRQSNEVVIVAIDDGSIDAMGYWPWRRGVHAQLLTQLGQAKAVGLDIVFNEVNPAYPDDDETLANAMSAHGRVVLPFLFDRKTNTVSRPLPILRQAAKAVGSINAHADEDGTIRSLVLQDTFANDEQVDHFALAMLTAAGETALVSRLKQEHGQEHLLISYKGPPASFTVYPYSSILGGDIPAPHFSGKYVLVGAWATGLGDYFSTPVSVGAVPMAGVEVLANGLQNALDGRWIRTPSQWQSALLAILPVLLVCLVLRRLSARHSLFASAVVLLLVFVVSWLLLRYAQLWFSPVASAIGVALTYPIWSWRSQEAALRYFDHELQKLQQERLLHVAPMAPDVAARLDGSLSGRVVKLHQATALLRQAVQQREETLRFISHDMRSPQNSILALTELQRHNQASLPPEVLLERINQYAKKTLGLVDGFVQLARAESMAMVYNETDLVDLLTAICDEHWPLAQRRQNAIVFTTGLDLALINANAGVLVRAFGNLLVNAINYSPDGAGIECRLSRQGSYWLVEIQDKGRGMSAEQLASLFTPFTRFSENVAGNPAGSGLGLVFVKTVVTRHGGEITVDSLEGLGSTFSVRLPVYIGLDGAAS